MLKKMLLWLSLVLLWNSSIVYAEAAYPYHSKLKNDISSYEQQLNRHVLIPSWLPPKYKPISAQIAHHTMDLTITFSQGWERRDGEIELHVTIKSEIKEKHLSNIKLKNGNIAFIKEEQLEGPFDNAPFDRDYVKLYFFDGDLLYTLGMHSRAINTAKMKRIIVKVANSMA